jgi:hypothetical protein
MSITSMIFRRMDASVVCPERMAFSAASMAAMARSISLRFSVRATSKGEFAEGVSYRFDQLSSMPPIIPSNSIFCDTIAL